MLSANAVEKIVFIDERSNKGVGQSEIEPFDQRHREQERPGY